MDVVEITSNQRQKLGNRRVTGKEQYYTPASDAKEIFQRAVSFVGLELDRVFLEPAGGTGAFVDAAKHFGIKHVVSMDIEPKHSDVQIGNFLESSFDLSGAICITNPPFGRNNSLSIPFFNKAAQHSDLIAFVVPRSWRKWSVLNRLNRSFELVDDWDLALDYVDEDGAHTHGVGNLRTCVQVWRRLDGALRELVVVPDHGLIQKVTPELADVSFTLFGYGCGTVKTAFPREKNSTQMFLKLLHPRALEALESVDFSRFYNHTAYTEALGWQEINFLLNEYLGLESREYSSVPSSKNYLGLEYSEQFLF